MKEVKKSEGVEKDTFKLALTEVLDEQKKTNEINTDLVSATDNLGSKVDRFADKLEYKKIINS